MRPRGLSAPMVEPHGIAERWRTWGRVVEQNVLTLALALIAILGGSFCILYGGIQARGFLPPLLVGVLLLSFGSTIPELAITLGATQGDLTREGPNTILGTSAAAIDNYAFLSKVILPVAIIIGSCFANLFLVGGLAGLILKKPYRIERLLYVRDLPFLYLAILAVGSASWWWKNLANRADAIWVGAAFLGAALLYLIIVLVTELRGRIDQAGSQDAYVDLVTALFAVLFGAVTLCLGVYVMGNETPGAIEFFTQHPVDTKAFPIAPADRLAFAQYGLLVIGIVVALPELVVTLFAWIRRDPEPVAGNLVASSIFNLLGVLGLGILVSHGRMLDGLDWDLFHFDFGVLLVGAGLLSYFMYTKSSLAAWEGLILLLLYAGYWCFRFLSLGAVPA